MKTFLVSTCFAVLMCTAIPGSPCVPGNLQTFGNPGAMGCQVETVQFTQAIWLTSPVATGDAAIAALFDMCLNGSFTGSAPLGCPASSASLAAFSINQSSLLFDSASLAVVKSPGGFAGLTIHGGITGSATRDSARAGVSSVPEPSSGLLVVLGLSAFGILRRRRGIFSGKFHTGI